MVDQSEYIFTLPDFYRATVPGATGDTPGELGPFEVAWPATQEIYGWIVLPVDGDPASIGPLLLEVIDESSQPIASDGSGLVQDQTQSAAVPCLEMFGLALRYYPLDRVARAHDRWTFSLKNRSNVDVDVACVALLCRAVQP